MKKSIPVPEPTPEEMDNFIECQIAAAIIKGETSGIIEDDDGSVYFWDLTVDISL